MFKRIARGLIAASTLALAPIAANAASWRAVDVVRYSNLPYPVVGTNGEMPVLTINGRAAVGVNQHGADPLQVWRHNGHRFKRWFDMPKYDSHGCVAADFAGPWGSHAPDGIDDLYCVHGANKGSGRPKREPNGLWAIAPRGKFFAIENTGAEDWYGRTRQAIAVDVNLDGALDLAIANEHGNPPNRSHARVFLNNGDGTFAAVASPLLEDISGKSVAAVEHNGRPWLYFSEDRAGRQGIVVIRTDTHPWELTHVPANAKNGTRRDLKTDDLFPGEPPALLVVWKRKLEVWPTLPGRTFASSPARVYNLQDGSHVTTCDLDGNGKQDIYVVQGDKQHRDLIVLNHSTTAGRSFSRPIAVPPAANGRGDTATCVPDYQNDRGAVLRTSGQYGGGSLPELEGENRLIVLRRVN